MPVINRIADFQPEMAGPRHDFHIHPETAFAEHRTAELPSMAAEDFAWFLEERPGAYIWIGNGAGADQAMLHNPHYDFNDEILALGASYWARLAESVLEKPVD